MQINQNCQLHNNDAKQTQNTRARKIEVPVECVQALCDVGELQLCCVSVTIQHQNPELYTATSEANAENTVCTMTTRMMRNRLTECSCSFDRHRLRPESSTHAKLALPPAHHNSAKFHKNIYELWFIENR